MARRYDSSITRVAPVFEALKARGHIPASLPRLCELPERDGQPVGAWAEPGELEEAAWWPTEKRLDPPRALLEHLISELAGSGRPTTVAERDKLFAGDEQALERALVALGAGSGFGRRAWYLFEGRTSVDAYIRTDRYIVLVEGKRTEAGPTTGTSWMEIPPPDAP